MLNLHSLKPLHNLKSRLLLLFIVAFLVFAGPAVTLQSPGKSLAAETADGASLSNSFLTPVYSGGLLTANCSMIKGWADWVDETTPDSVDIYINGGFKARIVANRCVGSGGVCNGFTYIIPNALKNGDELSVEVKDVSTGTQLSGSPLTIRCGAMLFPTLPGPVTSVSGEGKTWEQAIHLTSTETGKITHIRFWKVPEECGSHVGRIWSDTGAQLRSANFTGETASGWQEAPISPPLQITAGTKYRISYNVNCYGGKILSGLTSPYLREPLIAWRGFYTTPSATFPNTSSASNFLADVKLNVPE
jgi:hypothetical protein